MKMYCELCGKQKNTLVNINGMIVCRDAKACSYEHPNSISNVLRRGGRLLEGEPVEVKTFIQSNKAKISDEDLMVFLEKYTRMGLTLHLDIVTLALFETWRRKREISLGKKLSRAKAMDLFFREHFNVDTLEEALRLTDYTPPPVVRTIDKSVEEFDEPNDSDIADTIPQEEQEKQETDSDNDDDLIFNL